MPRALDTWGPGTIVLLTLLAYSPVLTQGTFVYEDPLLATWLHWGPLNPILFHMLSVCVHCLNALLVYRLVDQLHPALALGAMGIFALHPIQTEAVAYVSNIRELGQTTGILLATYGGLRAGMGGRILMGVGVVVAVMMKPNGVVVVPLVLWTLYALKRPQPSLLLIYFAVFGASHYWLSLVADPHLVQWWRWRDWMGEQAVIVGTYFTQVAWPTYFSLDHDWSGITRRQEIGALSAFGVAVLGTLVYHRRYPVVTWAVGWILLSVSVRLLVPSVERMHEHATYIGMAVVGLVAGIGVQRLAALRISLRERLLRRSPRSAHVAEGV